MNASGGGPGGLGVDVGARRIHCVELSPDGRVVRAEILASDDLEPLLGWASRASVVAIDAPETPSTRPHLDDPSLSPKFRPARCAEVELGRAHGIWVPWVAPAEPPFPAWMEVGFRLFRSLGGRARAIETYPHAVFRTLAGGPVPPKRTVAGRVERVALLGHAGVAEDGLSTWGHDGLDALAAALVAIEAAAGTAAGVTCGHDGSAIWLPGGQATASRRPPRR